MMGFLQQGVTRSAHQLAACALTHTPVSLSDSLVHFPNSAQLLQTALHSNEHGFVLDYRFHQARFVTHVKDNFCHVKRKKIKRANVS